MINVAAQLSLLIPAVSPPARPSAAGSWGGALAFRFLERRAIPSVRRLESPAVAVWLDVGSWVLDR